MTAHRYVPALLALLLCSHGSGCKADLALGGLEGWWKVDQGTSLVRFGADGTGEVYKDGFMPGTVGGPCDPPSCTQGSCVQLYSIAEKPFSTCMIPCSSTKPCPTGSKCGAVSKGSTYCVVDPHGYPVQPVELRIDSFNTFNIAATEGASMPGHYMCYGCRVASADSIECDDIVGGGFFLNSCNLVRVSGPDAGVSDAQSPTPDSSVPPADGSIDAKKD